LGFELFHSVRGFQSEHQFYDFLCFIIVCVLLAINALPLNTDATAVQYTTYLIKFAEYVGKIVDDGSIYADRECFTDENTAGFLLKYFNEKANKPHFKKRGRDFSIAGVEFDTDIDECNENSSSSSVPILNNNVNSNYQRKSTTLMVRIQLTEHLTCKNIIMRIITIHHSIDFIYVQNII